jgi:hypothetical protein
MQVSSTSHFKFFCHGFTRIIKAWMAPYEVRELLQHMERIPLLRHEVLSFFYKFKLDYKDLVESSIKDIPR